MVQSQGKEVRSVRYSVMGLGVSCIAVIRRILLRRMCAVIVCVCFFFIAFFNSNDLTDFYDFLASLIENGGTGRK